MKFVRDKTSTSTWVILVVNDLDDVIHTPMLPAGLSMVQTITPELKVKMDLVMQITRSVMLSVDNGVYNQDFDIKAVTEWVSEIYGDLWQPDARAVMQMPDEIMMSRPYVKDRIQDMAERLLAVEMFEKLINQYDCDLNDPDVKTPDYYPGLMTINYLPKEPYVSKNKGKTYKSVRLISKIPVYALDLINTLYNDEKLECVDVTNRNMLPKYRQPLVAHKEHTRFIRSMKNISRRDRDLIDRSEDNSVQSAPVRKLTRTSSMNFKSDEEFDFAMRMVERIFGVPIETLLGWNDPPKPKRKLIGHRVDSVTPKPEEAGRAA